MNGTNTTRLGAWALTAAMTLAFAGTAQAQTINDEVRCVLLSNAMASGADNPRGRQIGASVGAYFMGRLDARPPADVKAAIAGQKRKMKAAAAATAMNACVARAGRSEARLRDLAR
ncbi:hypothetical protein LPN01_11580 [Sphingomonas sp. A2-49]|uniref:hypothetical protein n=1 Tax=Sphingomonas sp. A2-49 TaxID=1391375 RepID=UPI0021D3AB35|nr:hypothetical protein [Sphingomonas sp. A2-49]MCU6454717.1 hypothetical protein [Sphingomonas sp. A2-49]